MNKSKILQVCNGLENQVNVLVVVGYDYSSLYKFKVKLESKLKIVKIKIKWRSKYIGQYKNTRLILTDIYNLNKKVKGLGPHSIVDLQ